MTTFHSNPGRFQLVSADDWYKLLSELQELNSNVEAVNAALTAIGPAVSELPIGQGQTWQNLLASRFKDTIYQNTTGRTIVVMVGTVSTTSASNVFFTSADGVTNWIPLAGNLSGTTGRLVTAIIPKGHYYQVTGAASLGAWFELR